MVGERRIVFETELDTYTSVEIIGAGGSGRVYRVTAAGGEFAIKVLDPNRATSSKVKRFKNELNFGRRVRHDHIVPILDSGVGEVDGREAHFFVMPRYERSLRVLLKDRLDPGRSLSLYEGLLTGVMFAHAKNVWHRDVKPENILFDASTARLLLGDFGIAHFDEEELHTAVETGDEERLANFQYAAPEQRVKGGGVDHRADIYALGLILNELFTGAVPHGTGYRRVAHVAAKYTFVDQVVERMIQSQPEKRYQTVEEIRLDLRSLSVGPALTKGRQLGAKASAADEKKRLFRSEEGVARACEQVTEAYDHLADLVSRLREECPVLQLEIERTRDEVFVRTGRVSAYINWYHPYSNLIDEARVTIRTIKGRIPMPSQRGHYVNFAKPERIGESEFHPDYTVDQGFCWVEPSGRHLSPLELGSRLAEEFLGAVDAHETSGEQGEW